MTGPRFRIPPGRGRHAATLGALAAIVAVAAVLVATPAVRADDDEGEHGARAGGRSGMAAVPMPKSYRTECAACHVAYPAGALPAASWQRLMAHLPDHFGTDASLDAPTVKEITTYLTAAAGRPDRAPGGTPPEDRITKSAWFVREHREVPASAWTSRAVGKPSRCEACHTTASQGVFDEHHVRIPR